MSAFPNANAPEKVRTANREVQTDSGQQQIPDNLVDGMVEGMSQPQVQPVPCYQPYNCYPCVYTPPPVTYYYVQRPQPPPTQIQYYPVTYTQTVEVPVTKYVPVQTPVYCPPPPCPPPPPQQVVYFCPPVQCCPQQAKCYWDTCHNGPCPVHCPQRNAQMGQQGFNQQGQAGFPGGQMGPNGQPMQRSPLEESIALRKLKQGMLESRQQAHAQAPDHTPDY